MNEAIGARLRDFKYPTRPIVPPKIETDSYGTSDRIRTYDLRIRSPLLYPTELRVLILRLVPQIVIYLFVAIYPLLHPHNG